MGCGESKHAVVTANTTVTKSKSKRLESNNNVPPAQNIENDPLYVKENEIPETLSDKKEAETVYDGNKNTLESGEEGEGNTNTFSDYTTKEDSVTNQEPENVTSDEEKVLMNTFVQSGENDPAKKIDDELKLESTSIGEDKIDHVEEKVSENVASTTETKVAN